tara:strand:+ start:849 stop:1025 length:177 start_codon:yes stop_codon:yes gene_type:complete
VNKALERQLYKTKERTGCWKDEETRKNQEKEKKQEKEKINTHQERTLFFRCASPPLKL